MILAILLLPLNISTQILKWKTVVNSVDNTISFKKIISSSFIGIALGFITPGKTGEMAKFLLINSPKRVEIAGGTFYEKLLDMIWIPLFGIISLITIIPRISSNELYGRVVLPLLILISIPFLGLIIYNIFKSKIKESYRLTLNKLLGFYKIAGRKQFFKLSLLSLMLYLIYTLQLSLIIKSMSETTILTAINISIFSILIKSLLPISFGDIGVREGATAFTMTLFNLPFEIGVLAGFLLFTTNVIIPSTIGVIILLKGKN